MSIKQCATDLLAWMATPLTWARDAFFKSADWLDHKPGLAAWVSAVLALVTVLYSIYAARNAVEEPKRQAQELAAGWCKTYSWMLHNISSAAREGRPPSSVYLARVIADYFDTRQFVRMDLLPADKLQAFLSATSTAQQANEIIGMANKVNLNSSPTSQPWPMVSADLRGMSIGLWEAGNAIEGKKDLREGYDKIGDRKHWWDRAN